MSNSTHTFVRHGTLVKLMAFEALTLLVASTLHLAIGSNAGAGVAEAVICLALIGGLAALVRDPERGVAAATAAVAFAILGFILGLTFTIRGGSAADVTYHATMLPVLTGTLVLLVARQHGRASHHRIG